MSVINPVQEFRGFVPIYKLNDGQIFVLDEDKVIDY